jgi:CRISPR-associated protein Cmr6
MSEKVLNNPNLGWLFYKDYFNNVDYSNIKSSDNREKIKRKSEVILNYSFNKNNFSDIGNVHLEFKTTYPGLLIGSGHLHEIKDLEGQLILGFQFDYTTGLPIIPASSIKGVLRSIFAKEDTNEKNKKQVFRNLEFIKDQLEEVFDLTKKENNIEIDENYIINLEKELFEGNDIFFDGEIIEGDSENKILADDFITPHSDPLKNPIPLRFVKVRPEVKFRFSFKLKDSEELSFNIEQKKLFFENILVFLGIGAKTNVGYGQLEKIEKKKEKQHIDITISENKPIKKEESHKDNKLDDKVNNVFKNYENKLGEIVQAIQNSKIESYDEIKYILLPKVLYELNKALNGSKIKDKPRKKYKEDYIPYIEGKIEELNK